ncbi:MAG: nucleoid-associated protein [Candidatus Kapabacteria bacterium]|nr:nucleoid-associated protein [Candidatus Kapabacteria bacterium]
MTNFYNITINRIILHQIVAKNDGLEHATVITDENLFRFSDQVLKVIIERLAKASQKKGKSFELLISDSYSDSFFGLVNEVNEHSDERFIHASIKVAMKLAQAQTVNTIPGGYLIMIDAKDENGYPLPIVIKAELLSALRYEIHNRESTIKYLDDIFLDPSSKKFKFALMQRRVEDEMQLDYPNSQWKAFIYDEQFSVDSKPAEYFYKDFLGFSVETNSKIQSKRFYDATDDFIMKFVENSSEKDDLIKLLKQEFTVNDETEVKPDEFANAYLHDDAIREIYMNEIVPYLPTTIEKDASLFKAKLEKKQIHFPNDILLTGPNKTFEYSVEIVNSTDKLEKLDTSSLDYTILKIKGKPYNK